MHNSHVTPRKLGNALQLVALAAIAIFTTACEWVPPPTDEEVFLNPVPESNFDDISGVIALSGLNESPTCFTDDGTTPFYDLANCSSGTTQSYTGGIEIACEASDVGSSVLRRINIAFGWPGEPGANGEISIPTVEYRGANFYLNCGDDPDGDQDGIPDNQDNCPSVANGGQEDWNGNLIGDACDDTDSDTVMDDIDNCITTSNTTQADQDGDLVGDACDDSDGDGVLDDTDNCVSTPNDQADYDGDNIGNACEIGGNGYYFYNSRSDMCLQTTVDGSNINAATCVQNTPTVQAFAITATGAMNGGQNSYLLDSRSSPTRCIGNDDILFQSHDDIDMHNCNGGDDTQQWQFWETEIGSGLYLLSPVDTTNCLREDDGLSGDSCDTTKAHWQVRDMDTHEVVNPNL
ncbi:MAG: thrombospondin type 3 repeat-containing protein [Pseudomonadales bacterium]|nr:thrombospondin type 3 repeat-containing protein [Pseudomonadales bacterium]